jgi:nucleoside-triphosphatase THEP1
MLIVLTGKYGAGKSTVCRAVIAEARARGLAVAGVTTERVLDSEGRTTTRQVLDLSTGARAPLNQYVGPGAGDESTPNWRFFPEGIELANAALRSALAGPAYAGPAGTVGAGKGTDLLVVDEIGPLELMAGKGFREALPVLRDGRYGLALVVVRDWLVGYFARLMERREPRVMEVSAGAAEAVAGEVCALLGEACRPPNSATTA